MTEQEFLQLKRQATGETYTIYQKMLHHKDKEICYTKNMPLFGFMHQLNGHKKVFMPPYLWTIYVFMGN